MSMTLRSRGSRHDVKCASIYLLGLLIVINCATAIDYAAYRKDTIPRGTSRQTPLTTLNILEELNLRNATSDTTIQDATEHMLRYGALLRTQILDTFGKLVYDHYDDFGMSQIEALYRIYRETLERKYNIFDIVPSVLEDPDTRPTKLCAHINEHVRTCLKESSIICMGIKIHDAPHVDTLGKPALNITRRIYRTGKIANNYPNGFSLDAVLQHLRAGNLRFTSSLFSGLLHNVQYDNFDDKVRTAEREIVTYLDKTSGPWISRKLERSLASGRTVSELLKNYLSRGEKLFRGRAANQAAYLSRHVVREIDAVSQNIELLGTVYDNSTINLKYLFELILPNDTVDCDIMEARDYLRSEIETRKIIETYLSIEKYQQTGPDQLLMEILGQLRDIRFAEDLVTSLYVHASFWHKNHMIRNIDELLELFDAYENLRGVRAYQKLMRIIDGIRNKLRNSTNVTIELLCSRPRDCLRIGLGIIANCPIVDDRTKRGIELFIDRTTSGCSCLAEDSSYQTMTSESSKDHDGVESTTEIPRDIDENSKETLHRESIENSGDTVVTLIDSTTESIDELTASLATTRPDELTASLATTRSDELTASLATTRSDELTASLATTRPDNLTLYKDSSEDYTTSEIKDSRGENSEEKSAPTDQEITEDSGSRLRQEVTESSIVSLPDKSLEGKESLSAEESREESTEDSSSRCNGTSCSFEIDECSGENCTTIECRGDDCNVPGSSERCVGRRCLESSDQTSEIPEIAMKNCTDCEANVTEIGCTGPDCFANFSNYSENCEGSDCDGNVTKIHCEGSDCSESSCKDGNCDLEDVESEKCEGSDCFDVSCEGEDCEEDSIAVAASRSCEGPDCPMDALVNSTNSMEKNQCRESDCSNENCTSNECGNSSTKICDGPDCREAERENCDGPECSTEAGLKCEGDDCPSETIEVECKDGNCPAYDGFLNERPTDCNGTDCPKINCTSDSCRVNETLHECEGPDCLSDILKEKEVCEGANCSISSRDESHCEGTDCSESDDEAIKEDCEGPDCLESNDTTEEEDCEGSGCPVGEKDERKDCEGEDCLKGEKEKDCEGSDCLMDEEKIIEDCEGEDCNDKTKEEDCEGSGCSVGEKDTREDCEGEDCSKGEKEKDCEGSDCPIDEEKIIEDCEGEDCPEGKAEKSCEGPDCTSELSETITSAPCTDEDCSDTEENCIGDNCTTNPPLEIEKMEQSEESTTPMSATLISNQTLGSSNATIFCNNSDPYYRRKLHRLRKVRLIDASTSKSRSSSEIFNSLIASSTSRRTKIGDKARAKTKIMENTILKTNISGEGALKSNVTEKTSSKAKNIDETSVKTSNLGKTSLTTKNLEKIVSKANNREKNPLLQVLGKIDNSLRSVVSTGEIINRELEKYNASNSYQAEKSSRRSSKKQKSTKKRNYMWNDLAIEKIGDRSSENISTLRHERMEKGTKQMGEKIAKSVMTRIKVLAGDEEDEKAQDPSLEKIISRRGSVRDISRKIENTPKNLHRSSKNHRWRISSSDQRNNHESTVKKSMKSELQFMRRLYDLQSDNKAFRMIQNMPISYETMEHKPQEKTQKLTVRIPQWNRGHKKKDPPIQWEQ